MLSTDRLPAMEICELIRAPQIIYLLRLLLEILWLNGQAAPLKKGQKCKLVHSFPEHVAT
jgi:hypothetical protein